MLYWIPCLMMSTYFVCVCVCVHARMCTCKCVPIMGENRNETVACSSAVSWSVITCRERASSQDSFDPLNCLLLLRPVRDPTRDFRVAPNPLVPPPGVWTLLWLRPNPCGCASKHFWYRSYNKMHSVNDWVGLRAIMAKRKIPAITRNQTLVIQPIVQVQIVEQSLQEQVLIIQTPLNWFRVSPMMGKYLE